MKRFNALIIDGDMTSRMRLKQTTSSVIEFGQVQIVSTFAEAMPVLNGSSTVDVIFVSWRFSSDDTQAFIARAKETPQGQDSAFISVMKSAAEGNSKVAESMMNGADGILCEPFSVDQLTEITKLATKIRKERFESREKAALQLFIPDILKQIDLVSHLKSSGCEPETSIKVLRELCAKIKNRGAESISIYYEIAIPMFENAPIPRMEFKTKNYKGASSRVKQRMERKMRAELQTKEGESAEKSEG